MVEYFLIDLQRHEKFLDTRVGDAVDGGVDADEKCVGADEKELLDDGRGCVGAHAEAFAGGEPAQDDGGDADLVGLSKGICA